MSFLTDLLDWFTDPANWRGSAGVPVLLVQHLGLTAASLGIAVLLAVPLGLLIGHTGRGGVLAVQVGNVGRAVPTLAVLVILVLSPIGRSTTSALIAFTVFAIPPLLTNTYVGMREVDRGAVEAARGMGMSGWQVLRRVELPLATPLLMNGVRLAAVQVVATVSIAAIAAFGGLGRIITRATGDTGGVNLAQVVAGALIIAVVALAVDGLFTAVGRAADPVGRARRRADRSARAGRRPTRDAPAPPADVAAVTTAP